MLNDQTIVLNLVPGEVPPMAYVTQDDVGRTIRLELIDGDAAFSLSPSYTYSLRGTKPSGTGFAYDDVVTVSGSNTLTFKTNSVMTAVEGRVRCGIIIYDGDEHVETLNFILQVQRAALSSTDIIDASDFGTIINDAVEDVLETAVHNVVGDLEDRVETLETAIEGLDLEIDPDDFGLVQNEDTGYVYPTYRGTASENGIYIATGGGGGGGNANAAVLSVTNTTGWLAATVSQPQCILSVYWTSEEDNVPTGDGTLTIRINNVQKLSRTVSQGDVSVNVGSLLAIGINNVKLQIADVYGNSRTIVFTVNYLSYTLSSTFDGTQIFSTGITYYYVATGSGNKLMHFVVDGVEADTELISTSGRQSNYYVGTLANGAHTLEAYFTVTVNEQSIESNHLYYDLIYADSSATGTIIASSYHDFTVPQFSTCVIPFVVWSASSLTSNVTLAVNGTTVNTLVDVDRSEHYWSYKATSAGTKTLTISSGGTTKTITLIVQESDIDVEAETLNLALYYSSSGRMNTEEHPETWTYDNINASLTDFLFDTDGWQLDEDGNTCLRVRGNARVTIPYQIFGTDFKSSGKTIELEFTTRDTLDPEAAIISCLSDGVGLVVTPQTATLYSSLINLSTRFKEDEHVRISFVVNKETNNRLIFCYINGIASGCMQYDAIDSFAQGAPVGITIGSNSATIDIYTIRVYDNDLTRYQILDNWIADTQDIDEMLDRYNRNDIYDDYGEIVISKLPADLPYMIINGPTLPTYKGDKKVVSIEFEDPTGAHPSFSAENVQIDVQGTSSAGYARKNFKCKFNGGFNYPNNTNSSKYQMTPSSIATKTFTFKADVASSEGANNVELVRLYDDFTRALATQLGDTDYITEPQRTNSMIRQGIDGFPMVIFHNDGTYTKFVGKYNFNNDKGTEEVYGFEIGDESWEIKNNTDAISLFQSGDFTNWTDSFEGRYPDENDVITNLQAFVSWVASTDTTAATGNALSSSVTYDGTTYTTDTAAYRIAKFKNELSDWANVKALEFYYLFTELFLLMDSRAKNAFPSFFGDHKWLILPYDMDTAIGINNEGKLSFGPYLEDTDQVNGVDVYNGQQSVLWINLKACFASQLKTLYNAIRVSGLSYAEVESRFEAHQEKWPEAIFNEDAYYKYIAPLTNPENGATATNEYLGMLLGSKEEQRKWWLYHRFLYIDNKYEANAITITANRVYFRANAVANMTLTPAHDTYLVAKYGSQQVQHKAAKDVPTVMECTLTSMSDTEVYIYGCENVKSMGDMIGLNVSDVSIGAASNLQYLKLGDSVTHNTALRELDLSALKKLKIVDLRNCENLTGVINVGQCFGLEELYLTGTQVTGLVLPRGGIIKKLHIPELASLEIINQPDITDFMYEGSDYSAITLLNIQGVSSVIPVLDIVRDMAPNNRLRIVGLNETVTSMKAAEALIDLFDQFRGINGNTAEIIGTITNTGSSRQAWLDYVADRYPGLTIVSTTVLSDVVEFLKGTLTRWDDDEATAIHWRAFDRQYQLNRVSTVATTMGDYALSNTAGSWELVTDNNGLKHLILRSPTVCSVQSHTLENSPVIAGHGSVYIPQSLYDHLGDGSEYDYKSATNWSTWTRIKYYPISAYPVTDHSTIKDSWETICENVANNNYSQYHVGDTKILYFDGTGFASSGGYGPLYMRLVAIDTDELASGNGTAALTWISEETLFNQRYNSTASTAGGWPASDLRNTTLTGVFSHLPQCLQDSIKEVKKEYYLYDGTTYSTAVGSDTLWIPSYNEIASPSGLYYGVYEPGYHFTRTFSGWYSSYTAGGFWLRNVSTTAKFGCFNSAGGYTDINANDGGGRVLLCFCI